MTVHQTEQSGLQTLVDLLNRLVSKELVAQTLTLLSGWTLTQVWRSDRVELEYAGVHVSVIQAIAQLKALFVAIPKDLTLNQPLKTSQDAIAYVRAEIAWENQEVFGVLFLNGVSAVLAFEKLFIGGINQAQFCMKTLGRRAVLHQASGVICVHNHPSGSAKPSSADFMATRLLRKGFALIDVELLDHLVITPGEHFSFAEKELLDQ